MTTMESPTHAFADPAQDATARLPRPLYAVAGAGDLAYRRLQRLPEKVVVLRERLAPRMRTFLTNAREVYGGLVARGEQVVDTARAQRAAHAPEPSQRTEPRGLALVAEDATETAD
jgi:hypothetical protein